MYQILAKPFKHEVINWLSIYNESTLFIIAMMQIIFITDMRQISAVTGTGWAMISLTIAMIFINFVVIIAYTIRKLLCIFASLKLIDPQTKVEDGAPKVNNLPDFSVVNNSVTHSGVRIMRYSDIPRLARDRQL